MLLLFILLVHMSTIVYLQYLIASRVRNATSSLQLSVNNFLDSTALSWTLRTYVYI